MQIISFEYLNGLVVGYLYYFDIFFRLFFPGNVLRLKLTKYYVFSHRRCNDPSIYALAIVFPTA